MRVLGKRYLFLVGLLLTLPLWGDPAQHVPVYADAAIFLRVARLKAIPALARLADSGEISRLEKPILELLVQPDAFVAAFIGLDERLVLTDVPSPKVLHGRLQEYYAGKSDYKIQFHTIDGMPAVTKIFYLPPRVPYHSRYDAVWVADNVAAFGDDDYPLPEKKLIPPDAKYRELSAPGTLAAALIPDPSRFGFDVMGLAQQLRNVRLTARETANGIELSGSAEVRDAKFLEQTAQLFAGATRILLVSFFGDDEALFQTLLQKLEICTAQGRLTFRSELDDKTLLAIQKYYDGHAARLRSTLKNNVKKTK